MSKNSREIRIPHGGDYQDPEKITGINEQKLAELYGEKKAMERWEIDEIVDDHDRKVRILKCQPKRTYFI